MIKWLHPHSITHRLTLAYAVAAAIILSITVVTLAYLESAEIDVYQTNEIKNRFSLFAYDVRQVHNLKDWNRLRRKYDLIVSEAEGRIFLRSDSADLAYQIHAPFSINPRHIKKHHGFSKQYINGNYFRAYSQLIPAEGSRPELILSLAVDAYYYEDLSHWIDVAFDVFLLFSISTIAVIGWILARRSLYPVDALSLCAAQISSQNLSERLPVDHLPSELKGLAESFNGALERLQQSHLRQAAFNSDVAHELRTPVNNLIGQSEVTLSKDRSAAELTDVMASNLEELERLRSIINDMLFLSHADQGEIALKCQKVDLAEEVKATGDFLEIILEENHNRLILEGTAEVFAEPNLLKRALTNLLNNAAQHGVPGTDIHVSVARQDNTVVLTVANRGNDIPPADLANIFNRFYRVSKTRSNSSANHGLGLSIVKAIVSLHGGRVFARSIDGVIEIGFTLPASNNSQT